MKIKNQVDDKLMQRTIRENSYPEKIKFKKNQSLKRHRELSKKVLVVLDKLYKRVLRDWSDFWDLCEDFNPLFCFICGRYIISKMRNDDARIKHPYKNGDPCHEYCWGKEMTVVRSLGKLNPEAELICHLDLGWIIKGSVCRNRVLNNPKAIAEHLIMVHDWNKIPEAVAGEIKEGRYTEKVWAKEIQSNNKKWFYDNQIDFDEFRNNQFLKPNGKPFPQRRNY